MQDMKENPEKWNSVEVLDTDPEDRQRALESRGDDGHNMVKVARLDENGNKKTRTGYDKDGQYTFVDNTTYKCVNCGVETGTRPVCYGVDCDC